jgi:drug/metabolite transporter (DMT)-like permease
MSGAPGTGRAAVLLGLVILLWGSNWPIMKIGLASIPPLTFAIARTVLGGVSLLLLLAATRRLCLPQRHDAPIVVSVAVLQIALFLGLTHGALMFVEAGRSAILAYTTPLWVVPLSALLLREHPSRPQLAALAFGMTGLAVLFNPLAVDYADDRALLGNGMLLAAALAWALAILHVRGHRWRATPLQLMPWQMLLGALLLLPAALVVEGGAPILWSWELVAVLAYNGPVASAFCYWAFVTVNRTFRASTTALGSLGVPVMGVLASAAVLGEPLTAAKLGGLALIGTGVAVLTLAAAVGRH